MKKSLLILVVFFKISIVFCQEKCKVTFNDGSEKVGDFTIRKPTFANSSSKMLIISNDTKEKYTLKDITKIIVYTTNDSLLYEVIDIKTNYNDKNTEKKLGLLIYKGKTINLYNVKESVRSGGAMGLNSYESAEAYAKKRIDNISYNIGYIYGAGPRGIKKRVRDYFSDCPKLIDNVEKDIIKKDETMEIIKFYDDHCGK